MADRTLTKNDIFDFVMLGKKIVVAGAGTVLDKAKSKVAELTDSENSFQERIEAKFRAMIRSGLSEAEARKAIDDMVKARLNRAFEKCVKPSGDSTTSK